MLFTPHECGSSREGRKLYQEVLFTDPQTAQKIPPSALQHTEPNYIHSAVASNILLNTEMPILRAARISISDMFYVAPVAYQDSYYAGGAIDLVPMELAYTLSAEVIAERKQAYSPTEEALVRAVLGFSGNERLATVASYPALWVDTRRATSVLFREIYRLETPKYWYSFSQGLPYLLSANRKTMGLWLSNYS